MNNGMVWYDKVDVCFVYSEFWVEKYLPFFFFSVAAAHSTVRVVTLKVKVQESDLVPQGDRFALCSAEAQRDPTHIHPKLLNKYLQICLIALFTSMAALVLCISGTHTSASPRMAPELAVTTMTIIHSIIFANPLLLVVMRNKILFIWGLYSSGPLSIVAGKSMRPDVHLLHL